METTSVYHSCTKSSSCTSRAFDAAKVEAVWLEWKVKYLKLKKQSFSAACKLLWLKFFEKTKFKPNWQIKLIRGEICVANYPPANGASLGSYLSKNGFLGAKTGKMGPIKAALAPKPANFFDEVIIFELVGDVVKPRLKLVTDRQTDRQNNILIMFK